MARIDRPPRTSCFDDYKDVFVTVRLRVADGDLREHDGAGRELEYWHTNARYADVSEFVERRLEADLVGMTVDDILSIEGVLED